MLDKENREKLVLKNLVKALSLCLLSVATVNATYVYESGQSLFDLTNQTGTTNMAVGDDQVSSAFDLGFTFTFYGQDFTSARMATNGCLHFKASGSYCNDYTPDPLPEITYTLYPFWTDLIRDNNSKVLAKNFSDKTVFGWYDLREYNRSGSDNSFEVILWNSNDTFDFRYGALDIINHDVLIGEQGSASETYTYLFHDECGVGTTNVVGTCVNTDWNNTSFNTTLENGGSLYGLGTGNALDCSDPLNNTACVGYDAAYLTQQCGIDSLYNLACPYYWDAYDDQQCDLDPQYGPFCSGYTQEESVAYYAEDEFDYGYTQEDLWYDEEYDEWLDPNDPCYENSCEGFTDEDWYELDVEQFGQEQVDEWFGEEVEFSVDGSVEWETTTMESYDDVDVLMDEYDIEQEQLREEEYITFDYLEEELYIEELYNEPILLSYETIEYDLPLLDDLLQEHFEHEEHLEVFEEEPIEFLEFETIEELEEYFEEEEFTEDEVVEELVAEEVDETSDLEDSESLREEREESEEESEVSLVENEDNKDSKKERQLNVVADTIRAASNSVSGTTSGTSIHSTGNSTASGGVSSTTSTAVASSASGGGISTSNSPSISAQVASSAIQTQQVLSMSTTDTSGGGAVGAQNTAVGISSDNTSGDNNTAVGSETVVASTSTTETSVSSDTSGSQNTAVGNSEQNTITAQNTAVGSMDTEIETAMGEVSTSEADQIADQIVAQNIQDQQEQLEEQQQETGEYADEAQLIAYMGYVQGFDNYRQVALADASDWYEPEAIYANVSMSDNNAAFIGLYGDSLTGMRNLITGQPKL